MANNLKVFNNYNDYETADLIKPAVSLVVSDNSVHYDPIEPTPPPTFDGKWLATYQDGHTESAACDSTSAISQNEITLTNLVSVEIRECVTSIGDYAFMNCTSLTSIDIPNSVTSIGWSAFEGCTSLTSIVIPNSVTSIDVTAFADCRSLTSVTIGSGVTSIGDGVFSSCSSLTSVTIPNSVTSIGDGAFDSCSSLTSVTIPNSVTTIGSFAFYGCSGLTSVTIGSGVTSIGDRAFHVEGTFKIITITAIIPPTLGDSVFSFVRYFYVPSESLNAYKSASGWSNFDELIRAIPNS